MAIYHLEAKVISRGAGRSAVAASAYLSCSNILNDYDGVRHDYTRKKGLVWQEVFLPKFAPTEWKDRGILWNAVEENEKTRDSRLAREFVLALPVELTKDQWKELLIDFIQNNFVSDGMCADVAIHDPYPPGHNPHSHIMVTVRPLDANGRWQYKTEKEYLCVRNGEERGFTAAEFKTAKIAGWEKQYQYKVGKKKMYTTPSAAEAQGYERVNKYPKSTKFGRQNPISERWDSEEQLIEWRKAWAEVTNRYLQQYGHGARIDHRSHADRGLDGQPTIHEGVVAQTLERRGIISERCEINRQIKVDNTLLRELKATVNKLMQAVKNTVPAVAEAMEKLRGNMIIFKYQLLHIGNGKHSMEQSLNLYREDMAEYMVLADKTKEKFKEKKTALMEKKGTPVIHVLKHRDLAKRIAELTEDLEELRSEKDVLFQQIQFPEDATADSFRKIIRTLESELKKLEKSEARYTEELNNALKEYTKLQEQAAEFDPAKLYEARLAIRSGHERNSIQRVQEAYGDKYNLLMMFDSRREVGALLNEEVEARSLRERLRQKQQRRQKTDQQRKPKHHEQER